MDVARQEVQTYMERITAYSWYLFNVSSLLVVMRWVIQSIGSAPPPSPSSSLTGQASQGAVGQSQSVERHDAGPEEYCPEVGVTATASCSDEKATGRERMVEAWASRCRFVSVDKETDIQCAARQLMDGSSRGLLVIDSRSGETVGVLQERDLVRAIGEHGAYLGRMRVGELVVMPR